MRILMLNHNAARQGTFLRCYHLARYLAPLGHSVTLLTTSPTQRGRITRSEEGGVEIVESPSVLWGGPRSGFDPWTVWQRCRYLRGRMFDVIHAFDSRPTVIHPALQSVRENPRALFAMDWADWWGRGGTIRERSGEWFERTLGHVETYYEEAFRRRAHAATVASHALAHRLAGLGFRAEAIHLLPAGCDHRRLTTIDPAAARAELPALPGGPLIGYLGVIHPPDAELLLRAFQMLRQRIPATLLLIGNPRLPDRHPLLRAPHVVVTGSLPYTQVNGPLCACDALVLPLRDNMSNRGRWPSKLNDYLCVSRPIVATAVGEVERLLRPHQAGILVKDDAASLAAGLVTALSDQMLAEKVARNARRVAETVLPWDGVAHDLLDFYAEQAGESSPPPFDLSRLDIRAEERELDAR
jgi:glycosyltransferase involved in cell wall biosynthesis